MMNHFGDYAKGVWGKWVSGTNLDTVNRLTAPVEVGPTLPLKEAVARTWTANRAREAGFGRATNITAKGVPGAYTDVQVKFTK